MAMTMDTIVILLASATLTIILDLDITTVAGVTITVDQRTDPVIDDEIMGQVAE